MDNVSIGEVIALSKAFGGSGGGSSGGGVLVVHFDDDTGALDKTWQEIYDADFAVIVGAAPNGKMYNHVLSVYAMGSSYFISVLDGGVNYDTYSFVTSSADGYPVISE